MFDNIQAYTGNVIGDAPVAGADLGSTETNIQPRTADEILEYAAREAEEIKANARAEAISERDAILENANLVAQEKIAESVVEAVVGLRMELFSAKAAMGEILSNAMDEIVGNIGQDKMAFAAVEKAIKDYGKEQTVTVFGNTKTLERLRLVAMGSSKNLKEYGFKFKLDAGLADGRCVLSNADARVEVGLDAQIDALKKVFHADAARAQKSAQTSLTTNGKLM